MSVGTSSRTTRLVGPQSVPASTPPPRLQLCAPGVCPLSWACPNTSVAATPVGADGVGNITTRWLLKSATKTSPLESSDSPIGPQNRLALLWPGFCAVAPLHTAPG